MTTMTHCGSQHYLLATDGGTQTIATIPLMDALKAFNMDFQHFRWQLQTH
jgi:hypothetical protein